MDRFTLAALLIFLFSGCAKTVRTSRVDYNFHAPADRPDYSRYFYWAAHPLKWDPSDSLPKAFRHEPQNQSADVFFIHPTTYTNTRTGWNADINHSRLNRETDYSAILYQASAFNASARVFAPRYRQAHLSAFYTDEPEARIAFDTAYADVKRAFLHFLERSGGDRPFVIAAHSQGAFHGVRLLRELVDGTPLQQRLVAAYLVGWPIFPSDFRSIPVCADSLQTGCFCSWRTYRKGYLPDHVEREKEEALVTNPLSWRTDSIRISRQRNRGSVLRNFEKVVPHTTDAQVHRGVLWVERPRFFGGFLLRTDNYHIGDINLYYQNIRENVKQRIRSFFSAN